MTDVSKHHITNVLFHIQLISVTTNSDCIEVKTSPYRKFNDKCIVKTKVISNVGYIEIFCKALVMRYSRNQKYYVLFSMPLTAFPSL